MRVLCINAGPIAGSGNKDLHLIKEGQEYTVYDVNPETGGYDIGVVPKGYLSCYWNRNRFIPLSDIKEETLE